MFLSQAVQYYESMITAASKEDAGEKTDLDPNVYCRLGHILLLLNHFGKGITCTFNAEILSIAHICKVP